MVGCLYIDYELMDELINVKEIVNLEEIFLVVDLMIGQDVVNVVKSFNEQFGLIGVVLIKFDGDICGGVVFFICVVINMLIKFVGLGEKFDVLELFYFECMVFRIFGMGDVLILIEKVQVSVDEDKVKELE